MIKAHRYEIYTNCEETLLFANLLHRQRLLAEVFKGFPIIPP